MNPVTLTFGKKYENKKNSCENSHLSLRFPLLYINIQCHLEFLLSGVNNSLDNDLEGLVQDFTVINEKRTLESVFLSWKFSTLQMKLAKVHSDNNLQTR